MFFWLDSFISIIWTIHTGITWYIYTDHSLPELENDPAKKEEHDRVFDMEKHVGIAVLVALNLIHVSIVYKMVHYDLFFKALLCLYCHSFL
jgi:hypothetical protein